jgi:hypothetical protein
MSTMPDNDLVVCIRDDYEQWLSEGINPQRLPVVQFQTTPDAVDPFRLGGWVLQRPNPKPPYNWVAIPLQAQSENEAITQARVHLT